MGNSRSHRGHVGRCPAPILRHHLSQATGRALILIVLLVIAPASIAAGTNLISERAYLEDPSGTLTPAEAIAGQYTPFDGMLSRGYTPSVHWLELQIAPDARESGPLVLRIRPTYLDDLQLYAPPAASAREPRLLDTTGDLHPWSDDAYGSLNLNVLLEGDEIPTTLYLRVETSSTTLVYPQLKTLEQALRADRQLDIWGGLLIGALAMIMLWGILQWRADRDWVMTSFVLKQAAVLTHAMGYMGYWRIWFSDWIDPALLNQIYAINIYLMTVSAIAFLYLFLREYQPNRLLLHAFGALGLLLPVQLALHASGNILIAVNTVSVQALIAPVMTTLLALTARVWRDPETDTTALLSRPALITFFGLLFVMLWIYVLPVLGVISFSPLTLYGILCYNLITSTMMFWVLQIRSRQQTKQLIRHAERVHFVEKEVERERERSEQHARFLGMLTHELKTPLATIRMLIGSDTRPGQQIAAAVHEMDQVIDRCVETGRLEDDHVMPNRTRFDLVSTVRRSVARRSEATPALFVHCDPDRIELDNDAQLVKTIIDNLIDNACKYGAADQPVHVSTNLQHRGHTRYARVSVTNALGRCGAPDPERVFQKYYRGQAARGRVGSGLGLYLSNGLAQTLGGEIEYTLEPLSHPNQVRFSLWLPA